MHSPNKGPQVINFMGVTMIMRAMISDVMITIVVTIRIIGSGGKILMGANNKRSGVSSVTKRTTRSRPVHIVPLSRRRRTKGKQSSLNMVQITSLVEEGPTKIVFAAMRRQTKHAE